MSDSLGILVVEDNPADADLIRELLPATGPVHFRVECVARLSAALTRLPGGGIDLVLLDLGLPDSQGMATLRQLRTAAPAVPVIVLTGCDNRELGLLAVQEGAQDFLVKGQVTADLLERAIRYSRERHKSEAALRESEARFRSLYENAVVGFYRTTPDGRILMVNPAVLKMLGFSTLEELTRRNLEQEGYAPNYSRAAFKARLERDGLVAGWEAAWTRCDGSLRFVRENCRVVRDEAGRPTFYDGSIEDITERKLAEAAREEERNLLRTLIDHLPDMIYVRDTANRFLLANEAFARQMATTTADIVGKADADYYPPNVAAGFAATDRKVFAGGAQLDHQCSVAFPNGQRLQLLSTKVPLKNAHGEVTGLVGVIHDITTQKLAEQKLRDSEEKFARMFNSSPVATCLIRVKDGLYLDANAAFLTLFEWSRDEAVGHTALELNLWVKLEQQTALFALLEDCGVVHNYEVELRAKSGQILQILWSGVVLMVGGERCLLGSALDITQRKRAEEQLKVQFSALSAAANGIVITDRKGKIEWVNPSFTELSGYTPEEAIGQNPRLLKSGEHSPDFYATLWATILAGNVWHGEMINRHKTGRLYTEDATITPILGANGEITHFVAIKLDVTERRALENQLRQAQKMESMGTLAGGIAHDFNNILAAMVGFGYLLQQDTTDNPEAQESVAEILQAANRAKDLVRQILTFSRQREQRPEIIRLEVVVKEALKLLRASLPAHMKIELHLAAEAPAVLADPTQVYQVVMNLATNALHAMEDRPGRLTVSLEPALPNAELRLAHPELKPALYARLTVADTGTGMDAVIMERIFDPFFTTKPVGKGTGLGLSVVLGIVKSHDGVITVESQVGVGTTFRVYFPAQTQTSAAAETAAQPAGRGHGQRILFVDDEPALTSVSQKQLLRLNYQVATAESALEALRRARENPAQFDLVITDLTMPELSGVELARQIHSLRPELPIILVSGYSASVNAETLREVGIQEVLEKPVSWTALAAAVQRVLRSADPG